MKTNGYVVTYIDSEIGQRIYGYFDSYQDAKAAVLKLVALGAIGIKARQQSLTVDDLKEAA